MSKFLDKENIRIIVSVILSFVLSIGVFVTAITSSALYSLNKDFVVRTVRSSKYTELAITELTDKLNDLAIPSGLNEDFFTGEIDKDYFEKLFYECLENSINKNTEYSVDISVFEQTVFGEVFEYATEQAVELSSETTNSLKEFSTECANILLTFVNPPILNYILPLVKTVSKYISWVVAAGVVLTVSTAIFLFKLNSLCNFRKYCFAALMGGYLTCSVIPAYLLITKEIYKVSISSPSLYAIVTGYANSFLVNILIFAAPLLIVALIILFFQIKGLIFRR